MTHDSQTNIAADDGLMSPAYLQLTLSLPMDAADTDSLLFTLPDALDGLALATSHTLPPHGQSNIQFVAHFADDADRAEITARLAVLAASMGIDLQPEFTILPPTNWLEVAYQAHKPLPLGRFVIFGNHDRPALTKAQIGLEIEAATAFGTGQHGTTAGCMLVLEELAQSATPPHNVADIGTGSGILALAAYKLWGCPVMATDIDPESIRVTRLHMQTNNVPEAPDAVTLCVANGTREAVIVDNGPYDLVIANILAGPLKEMAPDLVAITSASGGLILLSGLLTTQQPEVLRAYTTLGCSLVSHTMRDEWSILLLRRG